VDITIKNGKIESCSAEGSINEGAEYIGGLCGKNSYGDISHCYGAGSVSGIDFIGGFCGKQDDSSVITSCFWDINVSCIATSDGGSGKTTLKMQNILTFTAAGWNFDNIWYMDGCPALVCFNNSSTISYSEWLIVEGVPENSRNEGDTPANDNIPNLLKYACGLSAMQFCNSSNLLNITEADSSSGFVVGYSESNFAVGVILEPIWSMSLSSHWMDTGISKTLVGENNGKKEWQAAIPLNSRGFVRLRVTDAE